MSPVIAGVMLLAMPDLKDPRELLKTLMEENPDATEQELFQLLEHAVKTEPELICAIIGEYVGRLTAH